MKLQISTVRFIKEDSNGNPINLFVLDLANGKPSIVRSAKEFLTDLNNSYLIGAHVKNPNHPELLSVLRDLRGATIEGNILFANKGDMWTVTENSRVVNDPNHPKYGKVAAGDQLPYERDMTLVTEGFLQIDYSPQIAMMNKQAHAYGMSLASMLNSFDTVESATTTSGAEPVDAAHLDDDVVTEAMGTGAAEQGSN